MIRFKKTARTVRAAGLGMALSLLISMSAAAEITIPPLGAGSQGTYGSNQDSYGVNQNGGSSVSYPSRLPALSASVTAEKSTGTAGQGATGNGSAGSSGTGAGSAGSSGTVGASGSGSAGTASAGAGSTDRPTIQSQGAVLYDATHGQFLFEQNADTRYYPASITKLLTALLVLERCNMNDTVTFSQTAVTNLESGAVTLKVAAGDKLSVKDCMYGLMLKSANEIANGLAEHVSGSISAFADLMNRKASSLGCTNTHFVNPNGLNDSNHYTTPRDMALIAKAAFDNQTLCQIASTLTYNFPATSQAPTVRTLTMGHKMLNPANTAYYYPGIVGGKTGYTSLAGNTLVTCAQQDGVRLIAVVMKSRQSHYADTKALLDYGFALQKAGSGPSGGGSGGSGPSGSMGGGTGGSYPGGGSGNSGDSGNSSGGAYPGGAPGTGTSPGGQAANGNRWEQDANGWRFVKADGTYARGECMEIDGAIYCFKEDQYMADGWNLVGGIWYHFRPDGAMEKNLWIETNGYWYYVDGNGSLATGTTTPDGYQVDGNGIWVK